MVDHRRRVENAIRIAKEIHGKRKREVLLQDQYPTSYMPHVGRQVMQSGGTPEDVAINPFADIVLPPEEKDDKPRDYRQPLGERVREGISKGFGEQRLGLKLEEQQRYDPTGIIQNMVAVPLDFTLRAPGAVIGGLAGLGAGLYGKLPGVDETQTNKMQRDLKILGDVAGMEAGNVRPRAPKDVSSIPRSGEVLPPEASSALRLTREAKEPTVIYQQSAPSLLSNAPEPPKAPLERPALTSEMPVREPTPPVEVSTAPVREPTPPSSNLSDLRQAQAAAKQAFEEAKVAVQADRTNPELKAQIAQRQKELMAATKEVEKAESAREPKPGATSNAPREPEYVPPRSEMGLYSYAAEVAAKARQAGKPEDLIAWLKAQPGVKLEELREAGAVRADGSYNPSFAPDIKKMTPNELAERLNAGVPEVRDFVRYGVKEIPVNHVNDLKEVLLNDAEVWRQVMSDNFRGYNSFANNFEREQYLDVWSVNEYLNDVIATGEGRIRIRGDAEYSPSLYPDLTTPGGKNYREIPLSLTPYDETPPTRIVVNGPFYSGTFATMDDAKKHMDGIRERAMQVFGDDPAQLEVVLRNINRTKIYEEVEPSFQSRNIIDYGHMKDVPNNLAWLRMQDVAATKPDGKALRVEETQSDISQKGRERGFRMSPEELEEFKAKTDAKGKEYERLGNQLDDAYYAWKDAEAERSTHASLFGPAMSRKRFHEDNPEYKKLNDYLDKLQEELYDEANRARDNDTALPRLPYMEETQQWTDLTTKRALIEAAKGGYTELQFITGDINRRRYEGYEEGDAGYHYDVNIPSSLKRVLKSIDPDAKIEKVSIKPEKTDRYLRDKASLEDSIDYYNRRIDELHQQMKGMIPNDLAYRNFEMEIDIMVGRIEEYANELKVLDKPQEFWSVEITPKMREKIKEGLPRFAIGGAITHMTVEEFAEALEE